MPIALATLRAAACSAILLVAAVLAGCRVQPPQVRLTDVEVGEIGLTRIDLVLVFQADNFNTFPIRLKSLEFQCATADGSFAQGAVTQAAEIPAQGSARVPVPVAIKYAPLLAAVSHIGSGDGCPYAMTGRAKFQVLGATITRPVTHSGSVPSLRVPQWAFRGVTVSMPEGKLVAMLEFDVKNESSCDIPVVSFDGSLKVGDRPLLAIGHCPVKVLPARKTTRLSLPVELGPSAAIELTRVIRRGEVLGPAGLHVDGKLKLGPPGSLRDMLLGRKTK